MKASPLAGARHPKIYAFTTPEYAGRKWVGKREGQGLLKVGFTEQDVLTRIKQILNPTKLPEEPVFELPVVEAAMTVDGAFFRDTEVHKQLKAAGVHRLDGEWFECTVDEARAAIAAVQQGTKLGSLKVAQTFAMRPEQEQAVEMTAAYLAANADPEHPPRFLWNAKMRFGKTFASYQLAKKMGWSRVLVLTYKPAVEQAWRDDLLGHADFEGWRFKGKADDGEAVDIDDPSPLVWFASFQDVLGTDKDSGGPKAKNEDLYLIDWDCVIFDEYHFGAWRDAAKSIYEPSDGTEGDPTEKKAQDSPDLDEDFPELIEDLVPTLDTSNLLFLSGTPFRALTEGEFLEDQVFNWTYSDEQSAKANWGGPGANPYQGLPKMHLLAYEMPEALKEEALNNQSEFSLTEFFRAVKRDEDGEFLFVHEKRVQQWLDLLRGQDLTGLWAQVSAAHPPPLPYEDRNLIQALQHSVWFLPGVASCKAMAGLLAAPNNTFFKEYKVIVAAGTGAGQGEAALGPVEAAIGNIPQDSKTITLSCGKLMTGVTVPAWAGIFMLRELKSPESYFQAAFRVQSPWTATEVNTQQGGDDVIVLKENCYVFDFSPNRALSLIVDYATRLRADLASERDSAEAIEEFMEFMPVLAFEGSSMNRLEASDVIDYLTRGISSSMLARRWNSPELLTLDMKSMSNLLDNPELLARLEQIEMFRNITDDLTAMISANKELKPKKLAKEKLTESEKKQDNEAKKKRDALRKRLQRFLTRIPAFMYLTDVREKSVKEVITAIEPDLFEKVTGLQLTDFGELLEAGVFNDSKMNDAVWKFRSFEEPSLNYAIEHEAADVVGGWSVARNERFARLIDLGVLEPDIYFVPTDPTVGDVHAVISRDYGLMVDGIRYSSPREAALAVSVSEIGDGWDFWAMAVWDDESASTVLETLSEIEEAAGLESAG